MIIRWLKEGYRAGRKWKDFRGRPVKRGKWRLENIGRSEGIKGDDIPFFFYLNITALFILRSNQLQLQNRYAKKRL